MRRAGLILAIWLMAAAAVAAEPLLAESGQGAAGRFVAAPGERAVVMGYPETGLEVWAYPLQILSGYQVRFREPGRIEPLEGGLLLTGVRYGPAEVERTYSSPDFVVHERLFTPLDEPGAILTYEVEGRPDVEIEARFQPTLDLMWPGGLGGQSAQWDAGLDGYVLREPLHGFSAVVRSPETVAHDDTANAARDRPEDLALVLRPTASAGAKGVRRARLVIAADPTGSSPPGVLATRFLAGADAMLADATARRDEAISRSVAVVTPDAGLNQALTGAELALDQAWVCAPGLGCGEVGGYGPSRPGRRPQYDWFFAGDGLVAVEGLLATGRFDRAREELDFVARYQNPANGMIWHEMSLSAPLIGWAKNYPYMYVHVDITYQYLSTLWAYYQATGDRAFLQRRWAGIEAAWRYCRSLIDPATRVPTIPADKQGQDEQDRLRDDIRLSSSWIDAADGFAGLAAATGRAHEASEAAAAAREARGSVAAHDWDAARGFWLEGHTLKGTPLRQDRSDAIGTLAQDIFTPVQTQVALDRLATPDFQADWGVRSLSAAAADYDPNAYSLGAVWGLGTASAATTFYQEGRPLLGWRALRGLAYGNTLDAVGHLHEVLAGDLYHPERESVPEQTWSSAGLLTATVHGLLGLATRADTGRLAFAPRLPGDWPGVEVQNLHVGAAHLDLHLTEAEGEEMLEVANSGTAQVIDFTPDIPLGARVLAVTVNDAAVAAAPGGSISFAAPSGATRVKVRYAGGARLSLAPLALREGDASGDLDVASARWRDGALDIHAYVQDPGRTALFMTTPLAITGTQGVTATRLGRDRYRLEFPAGAAGAAQAREVTVRFAPAG